MVILEEIKHWNHTNAAVILCDEISDSLAEKSKHPILKSLCCSLPLNNVLELRMCKDNLRETGEANNST
jgi:hypothetical protein